MTEERLNGCRNLFLIPVALVVLCIFAYGGLWALSNYKDPQLARVSEQEHNLPNGSTNFMPLLVIAIPFVGLGLLILARRPYHAHRRHAHVYAEIMWEKDRFGRPCVNKIMVHNLDDVDVAELSRYVWWSRMYSRERIGGGRWVWKFNYMGTERIGVNREEDFYSDPSHIARMRDGADCINQFANDYLNPSKDRDAERRKR